MGWEDSFRLTALFAVLTAIFVGLGYLWNGLGGMVLGLFLAGGLNFYTYYNSDKLVLRMHRAEKLGEEEYEWVHEKLEDTALKFGIPKPELYITEQDVPNAFATGRNPENSAVCLTRGLIEHLSQREVEGVIAHEMSHIDNRDTLVSTVAGTLAGAVSMVAQMMWFSSFDGDSENPLFMVFGIVLAPLAASMVKMAISRSREYKADSSASEVTDPGNLADALESIDAYVSTRPMEKGMRGASHLYIMNPFKADTLTKLFSTHPPTEERISRLRKMGR